jgi:hypothetical protein
MRHAVVLIARSGGCMSQPGGKGAPPRQQLSPLTYRPDAQTAGEIRSALRI